MSYLVCGEKGRVVEVEVFLILSNWKFFVVEIFNILGRRSSVW